MNTFVFDGTPKGKPEQIAFLTAEVLKAFSADRIVESVLDSLIQSEKTEPTKGGVVMVGAFEQYMNTVLEEKMEKEKKAWLLEKQREKSMKFLFH